MRYVLYYRHSKLFSRDVLEDVRWFKVVLEPLRPVFEGFWKGFWHLSAAFVAILRDPTEVEGEGPRV